MVSLVIFFLNTKRKWMNELLYYRCVVPHLGFIVCAFSINTRLRKFVFEQTFRCTFPFFSAPLHKTINSVHILQTTFHFWNRLWLHCMIWIPKVLVRRSLFVFSQRLLHTVHLPLIQTIFYRRSTTTAFIRFLWQKSRSLFWNLWENHRKAVYFDMWRQ